MSAEELPLGALLAEPDHKACCASVYEAEAVAWLLDGELHPGGRALTRRVAELAAIRATDRVLDVASGDGATAHLLADEIGAHVTGVELGSRAVAAARARAREAGLDRLIRFVEGDAEALPFDDGAFAAVICECSLCTFPDKATAVGEMARVLEEGGRVAIAEVTAEDGRLPPPLRSAAARVACIADALPAEGYLELLEQVGLEPVAVESHGEALAAMVDRVEARLRLARMLRTPALAPFREQLEAAIELAGTAREAVREGRIGYSLIAARRPGR